MRWIFFSLLAANLGIFIWWQTAKPPASPVAHKYITPAGVGSVVLLSEADKQAGGPPSPVPPAPEAIPVPVTPNPEAAPAPADKVDNSHAQCVLVGPYENSDQVQQVLQKLQAKEINAHLFELELAVSGGFQVYLDGFENRAQAKKRLDELQAGGIDSFIVPKGEFINTIALGSFDQEGAAKGQQEKLAAAGIAAKIRESKRPVMEL
ncbi:MAG TPA: SPOR domain-containing protein, partial [Cellvibrionaceae bacterium]|nr:SPOR domain-containing protein [Cellvibrionaceae bacterium]